MMQNGAQNGKVGGRGVARCGGGEGEVNLPLSFEEEFSQILPHAQPSFEETVRRIESASRTPPHSCWEQFRLTGPVFDRIGFEVCLRRVLSKCKKYSKNISKIQTFVDSAKNLGRQIRVILLTG